MTDDEKAMAIALGQCSFLPGLRQKMFAMHMASIAATEPHRPLSPRQSWTLHHLVRRYRRQIADARLRALAEAYVRANPKVPPKPPRPKSARTLAREAKAAAAAAAEPRLL